MRLFDGVPAVQTWTEIINEGSEDQGLTYVSSFMYQGNLQRRRKALL